MNFPAKKGRNNFSANAFLLAAFVVLIGLPLFQKGTFIDGELYKTVAYNDALLPGSFWSMKYTNTCMPEFCEQPPLYPFLLGRCYRAFGNHYLIDRCFTFALFLIFIFLLYRLVRRLFSNARSYFLLFIFLMLSVPVWCWSYVNQVIEPLVAVFVISGILSFVCYLSNRKFIHLVLFAASSYCAFLTKGFQSCFIMALPLSYALLTRFSRSAIFLTIVGGCLFFLALLLTLVKDAAAKQWFDCYYNARLVLTLQNVGNTTDSHLEIIVRFFTELIVPFLTIAGLLFYLVRKKNHRAKLFFRNFISNKLAVSLLITSLAGSFPYAISLVQRGFYLVPSFICFLLALLLGFRRYWLFAFAAVSRLNGYKPARVIASVILIAVLIFSALTADNYKRDEKLLGDIAIISPFIPAKDTVLIEGNTWNYFSLHSYLYRLKEINLTATDHQRKFFIRDRSSSDPVDPAYTKLPLNTQGLDLYSNRNLLNPSGK